MKNIWKILLNVLLWGVIITYVVFAARYCRREQQQKTLEKIQITVQDYPQQSTVSPEIIREWLDKSGAAPEGSVLEQVDTENIRSIIASHPFVSSIQIHTDQSGTLHIQVSQRHPSIRVMTDDGYDFYVSDDLWIIPTHTSEAEYVPVVTGKFPLPFETGWFGELNRALPEDQKKSDQNYQFLVKLIKFVTLTEKDPFWRAGIVQFVVSKDENAPSWMEPEIELVPRVGNHIIKLGTLDDARGKLDKLRNFYEEVLDYEGWDLYKVVNIEYNNQVVCTK